jgi:hypothetical protein
MLPHPFQYSLLDKEWHKGHLTVTHVILIHPRLTKKIIFVTDIFPTIEPVVNYLGELVVGDSVQSTPDIAKDIIAYTLDMVYVVITFVLSKLSAPIDQFVFFNLGKSEVLGTLTIHTPNHPVTISPLATYPSHVPVLAMYSIVGLNPNIWV